MQKFKTARAASVARVAVVVVGVLTFAAAAAQNPPSAKPTDGTTQGRAPTAPPLPAVPQRPQDPGVPTASPTPTRPQQEQHDQHDVAIASSAVVQAVSAAVVAFLTCVVVWYNDRGWRVAKQAADAAKQSADTATKTLHLTQAADVVLLGIRAGKNTNEFRVAQIRVAFKNCGKTRARQVAIRLELGLDRPEHRIVAPPNDRIVLGPGEVKVLLVGPPGEVFLSTDDWQAIVNDRRHVKLWTSVSYVDVFGMAHSVGLEATWVRRDGVFRIDRETDDDTEHGVPMGRP